MLAENLKALVLKVDDYNVGINGHVCYSTVEVTSHTVEDGYSKQVTDIRKHLECPYIEHVSVKTPNGERFDLWLDEVGKLENKRPCVPLIHNGRFYDVVVGHTLVTRCNMEGDIVALTDEDIDTFLKYLNECWKIACGQHKNILNLERM